MSIGVAAAVRGGVQARATGAEARRLAGGSPLFLNDQVRTDAQGTLQAMLKDETVFTLGPNASLVLDRFVYDPGSGAGAVSARITEGIFRFVTGKVARRQPSAMKVTLPVGSLGIEGTIVAGRAEADRTTVVLVGPGPAKDGADRVGAVVVQNAGGTVRLTRPGFGTILERGRPPTAPFEVSPTLLQELTGSLLPPAAPPERGAAVGFQEARGVLLEAGARLAAASGLDASALMATAGRALAGVGIQSTQDLSNLAYRFTDPNARWEDFRLLQGFGSVPYNATGAFTSGGVCLGGAANCTGTWGYALNLDMNARTLSGNTNITIPGLGVPLVAPVAFSYDALSGIAASQVAFGGAGCTPATCNASFALRNADGLAGKALDGNVTFNNGVFSGSGAVSVTRP